MSWKSKLSAMLRKIEINKRRSGKDPKVLTRRSRNHTDPTRERGSSDNIVKIFD
jgi:hypothetical protein